MMKKNEKINAAASTMWARLFSVLLLLVLPLMLYM
jgi:hypothetical protein